MESRLLLADDLFLCTINDDNGRMRVEEGARAILLGAGLLGELMEFQAVSVSGGEIRLEPARSKITAPAAADVMSYLARDAVAARIDNRHHRARPRCPITGLKDWLEILGTESYSTGLIAHRMYRAGLVDRVHVGLRRRDEFRPSDLNDALAPYVRLGSVLVRGGRMGCTDVLLFGLLLAADLTGPFTRYWPTLAGRGPTFLADRFSDRRDVLTASMAALVDTTRELLADRALINAP